MGYGKGIFGRTLQLPRKLEVAGLLLQTPVEDEHDKTPTMYPAGTSAEAAWPPPGCCDPIQATTQISLNG